MLLFLVLWPMAAAVLIALIGNRLPHQRDRFAPLASFVELIAALLLLVHIVRGAAPVFQLHGFFGSGLLLCANGFRSLWVALSAFAWSFSSLLAPSYLSHGAHQTRYYAFTLLTLGASVGVFLSGDLFSCFICFEIMSLASWVWVAHEDDEKARYAADTYLAVAVIGGLVLLMGLFLLYSLTGTLVISALAAAAAPFAGSLQLYAAGILLLLGFGAKAGMFPLHFWLPMAHPVAPAPASALLSGLLTKCGVFGILVLCCEIFRSDIHWGNAMLAIGLTTMLVGALLALFSVDLKRTLACSSVSQIGFILFGCALLSLLGEESLSAAGGTLLHMVNHTLIKLVLFLVAGIFAMNCHTLDLNRLRGAGRSSPLLAACFAVGACSVSGIPLFSGYASKTLLHEALLEYTAAAELTFGETLPYLHVCEWLFLLAGGMTLAYMTKLFFTLFLAAPDAPVQPLSMTPAAKLSVAIPAALLLMLGVVPAALMNPLAYFGMDFLLPQAQPLTLHYFSIANLRGAGISLLIGFLLYTVLVRPALADAETGLWRDRWPVWLDLEKRIYRPLVLQVFPSVLGSICRVLDYMTDAVIVLLRGTVLSNLGAPKRQVAGLAFTDWLGRLCDHFVVLLNHTIRRKHPIERSFVYTFAEWEEEAAASGKLISASLSFGLLMFCIGLCLTLFYLLF